MQTRFGTAAPVPLTLAFQAPHASGYRWQWLVFLPGLVADHDGAVDPNVEKSWSEEAERRHRELKGGLIEPIPPEHVYARARKQIN